MARGLVSWPGQAALFRHLLGEFLPALYEPFRLFVNKTVGYSSTDQVPWTSLAAGASSGAVGGMIQFPRAREVFDHVVQRR
jgi:solute carrier family 25, member 34/35